MIALRRITSIYNLTVDIYSLGPKTLVKNFLNDQK